METNPSQKTSLFQTILIVILIMVAGGAAFFYWQQKQSATTPFDTSPEAVRAKCLEDAAKMTDEELVNEIYTLKYPEEIDEASGEDRIDIASRQMIKYFVCRLRADRNEELYQLAKDFFDTFKFHNELNRQEGLARVEEVYAGENLYENFYFKLALADFDQICPEELSNSCTAALREVDIDAPTSVENCRNICKIINEYSQDKIKLDEEIIDFKEWSDDPIMYRGQYWLRTAIAYRFGGQELALKVCQNVNESEKEDCQIGIDNIKNRKEGMNCDAIRGDIKRLICQYR